MWRYGAMLPAKAESVVTLGEGMTALKRTPRIGERVGGPDRVTQRDGPRVGHVARGLGEIEREPEPQIASGTADGLPPGLGAEDHPHGIVAHPWHQPRG